MDINLLERFLLELVAPEAKAAINKVFLGIRTEPIPVLMAGLGTISEHTKKPGTEAHVAAVNGLVLGVALGYAVTYFPDMTPVLQNYIEQRRRAKGENVLDIFHAKAGK